MGLISSRALHLNVGLIQSFSVVKLKNVIPDS